MRLSQAGSDGPSTWNQPYCSLAIANSYTKTVDVSTKSRNPGDGDTEKETLRAKCISVLIGTKCKVLGRKERKDSEKMKKF